MPATDGECVVRVRPIIAATPMKQQQDRGQFWRQLLAQRSDATWGNFSWVSLRTLVQSANDQVAQGVDASIINRRRMRWMAAQRAAGIDPHAAIKLRSERSLIALGDPGEMDASQYVLVRELAATEAGVLLLMSDIVYPAGHINAWADAVYLPYFGLPASAWEAVRNDERYVGKAPEVNLPPWKVLAMPGNHDWYDGLTGFMFHACSAEILPDVTFSKLGMSPRARLARALWRLPRRPDRERIHPLRAQAAAKQNATEAPGAMPFQPAPYFSVELGDDQGRAELCIICVDTGINGSIDVEQAEWLRQRLEPDGIPKVVMTGKPLVVDDKLTRPTIDFGEPPAVGANNPITDLPPTLTKLLMCRGHEVIAWVAGDIHNAQRIELTGAGRDTVPKQAGDTAVEPADRTIAFEIGPHGSTVEGGDGQAAPCHGGFPPLALIAGGGGAYLKGTHTLRLGAHGELSVKDEGLADSVEVADEQHWRFPSRERSVLQFSDRVKYSAGAVVGVVALALIGLSWALVELMSDGDRPVRINDWDVALFRLVWGAFATVAALVVVALAWMRLASLRYLVVPIVLAGVLLWPWWTVSLGDASLLAGATLTVVLLPLVLLMLPQLRAFSEVSQYLPTKRIIALAAGTATALVQGFDDLDAAVVAAVAGLAAFIAFLIGRLSGKVRRRSERHAAAGDRRLAHVLAVLTGVLVVGGLAVAYWLAGKLANNVGEALRLIMLAEGVLIAVAFMAFSGASLIAAGKVFPKTLSTLAGLTAVATGAAAAGMIAADMQWWLRLIAALSWAIAAAGLICAVGLLLGAARRAPEESEVVAALQARDHGGAKPDRSLALLHAMAVAAVPGISEIAESTEPPFAKSFLTIELVTSPGREICFSTYAVDDERRNEQAGHPAQPPKTTRDVRRGSVLVDRVRIKIDRKPAAVSAHVAAGGR